MTRQPVALLLACALAACAPTTGAPSASASPSASLAPAGAAATAGSTPIAVRSVHLDRAWYTVPDGLEHDRVTARVEFAADPTAAAPRLRVDPIGREVPLAADAGGVWTCAVDLTGIAPGAYKVGVTERGADGRYALVNGNTAGSSFTLSAPEYVVWTLDFEGDAASDTALANTAAVADGLRLPMTLMWNPRVWTTDQVSAERAVAMRDWAMTRAAKGDEIALHLHAWTDFVRAAGVTPRTAPNWAGRSDGYDVPLTAFDESETGKLILRGLALMAEHGMPRPTSFRAGGLFANAANLRAVASAGFDVDTSATAAGGFGRLPLPWTLPWDAQPYRPSAQDANRTGDLPLLEVPNIAGNTYALDVTTIHPIIAADLAMLAPTGQWSRATRVLTLVSHPGTIDATERAAIESLFRALEPFRYDRDAGPLRFVTLAQLAKAMRP